MRPAVSRCGIEAERHRHAPRIAEGAGQNAVPTRVSEDVVEQEGGGRLAAVIDLGDRADLQIPVRARDVLQLSQLLYTRKPARRSAGRGIMAD